MLLSKEKAMKDDFSPKKDTSELVSQAETIKRLNETKQYTLMATALLETVLTDSTLTAGAAKLWKYLYTKAIMDEKLCVRIKYKDLAEKFNRAERTMKRYVENLKENGYLYIESNFHYHGQRANTFYLRIPDPLLKRMEDTKDRKGKTSKLKEMVGPDKNVIDNQIKEGIRKKDHTKNESNDKVVTLDHDTNDTLINNIKKDILLENNNNVVVDFVSPSKQPNPQNVLCGTIDKQISNDTDEENVKIKTLEKVINKLYTEMGLAKGKEKISIFDEIRKLQAQITGIHLKINQRKQAITLGNSEAQAGINPYTDFGSIEGERKLSANDIAKITKCVERSTYQTNQKKVCNEIIYAVRYGSLKMGLNGNMLGLNHAISIALKLIRENRWETPSPLQNRGRSVLTSVPK